MLDQARELYRYWPDTRFDDPIVWLPYLRNAQIVHRAREYLGSVLETAAHWRRPVVEKWLKERETRSADRSAVQNRDMLIAALDTSVQAAIITAGVSLLLGVLTAIWSAISAKHARRRDLYSCAFKAALAWEEMLYRVRRRAEGDEAARALINRFHELQEEVNYHQGWLQSESAS